MRKSTVAKVITGLVAIPAGVVKLLVALDDYAYEQRRQMMPIHPKWDRDC